MRITYDDLSEFAKVVIRCNNTAEKGKCSYCPFFDRCDVADKDSRHIMFGDIAERCRSVSNGT